MIPSSKAKILIGFFVSFIAFSSLSQNTPKHCGTDEMHQELFKTHPEYNAGILRAYERLQADTKAYEKQNLEKSDALYVIPIVFHVIHNYGVENINDDQILDAVKQLNIQFRKLNADTADIVNAFKSIAADPQIEFRLAQKDPNGNCTSGITRTVSPLTSIGDHQVKSLIHWPPNKYLNVYICAEAAELAGHALLPSAADTISEWDGIVMAHDYIGTIGTSEYFRRTVLSHEVGHYLNLQHIWGGNNVPNYYYLPVGNPNNCAVDDEVEDTPLTIGWSSCGLNNASCGSLDNVQNYMDYAYCALMFTEGQKTRMHACLNSTVANRNNLWSPSNLIATGIDGTSSNLCQAKFVADKRIACVGETITLTDVSLHGVQSRTWTITGGNLSATTDSTITVTFNTPGKYAVNLSVSNGNQNLTANEIDYITILPEAGTIDGLHEPFDTDTHFDEHWSVIPKNAPNNWSRIETTGFNSLGCLSVQNFTTGANGAYEFISQPFDASGLDAIAISYDYAYARKQTIGNEQLKVSISTDCGETWLIRKTLNASSTLRTVDTLVTENFIPSSDAFWKNDIVTNITSAYLTDNLQFKFTFDSKAGNNIYLDNIRIGNPATLGLNDLLINEINCFPNPSSDLVSLSIPNGVALEKVHVYNLMGQEITELKPFVSNSYEFSVANWMNGLYLLQIQTTIGVKSVRLLVQK
jgi:PKD repeat protein